MCGRGTEVRFCVKRQGAFVHCPLFTLLDSSLGLSVPPLPHILRCGPLGAPMTWPTAPSPFLQFVVALDGFGASSITTRLCPLNRYLEGWKASAKTSSSVGLS